MLRKLDQFLIKLGELDDFKGVEELARIELTNNRIAVVVASDLGIYELEPHLTKLYGNRLGWVALRRGENDYTLRQMDLFMPVNLEDVYQRLELHGPGGQGSHKRQPLGGIRRYWRLAPKPRHPAVARRNCFGLPRCHRKAQRHSPRETVFIQCRIFNADRNCRHCHGPKLGAGPVARAAKRSARFSGVR